MSDTMPMVPAKWTLAVGGLVERPLELTLDQLRRMPLRKFAHAITASNDG
jgi:DMSO/TMAO reductase YedYZ molybdopterin-dependent catalytic subunit